MHLKTGKNILFATILGYVLFGINILSGLFVTPMIINFLGKSDYALFTLSSSLISLFLLDFGLGATSNTFLSKARASGDKTKVEQILGNIYKTYLIIDMVLLFVFIFAYGIIDNLYVGLTESERQRFKFAFLLSSALSLISFPCSTFNGVLLAYECFTFNKILDILQKLLYLVLIILCVSAKLGLYVVILSNYISSFVCLLLKYLHIRFKLGLSFRGKYGSGSISSIIKFSSWTLIISICSRLVFNITPSILGIVSNSEQVAVFGIVSVIEGYVYTFGSITNGLFLPKIARLYNEKESFKEKLQSLAQTVGKIQFSIVSLIIIGFILCGKTFISVWISDQSYNIAYICIVLVIARQLINVPQILLYDALFITGDVKQLAIISLIKATVNLVLCFVFSKLWGCFGASLAICVSRTIELLLFNLLYKTKLGVDLIIFFKKTFALQTIAIFVTVAVFLPLYYILFKGKTSFTYLAIEIVVVSSIYLLSTYLIVYRKDGIKYYLNLLKK